MAVADFYNALHKTRGIDFTPFDELTSAEQKYFEDAFKDDVGDTIAAVSNLTAAGAAIKYASVVISNTRMLTLRATPEIIVPAVAEKIIVPLVLVASTPEATTARVNAVDVRLRWQISSTVRIDACGDIDRTTMVGSTSTSRVAVEQMTSFGDGRDISLYVNKPLILHNVDTVEYASGSADNQVTFRVTYILI